MKIKQEVLFQKNQRKKYPYLKNLKYNKGSFKIEEYDILIKNIKNKIKDSYKEISVDTSGKLIINGVIEEFAEEFEFVDSKASGGHCLLINDERNREYIGSLKVNPAENKNFDVYKLISNTVFHRGHILGESIIKKFKYFQKSKKNRKNIFPITVWANKPSNADKYGYNMTYYEDLLQKEYSSHEEKVFYYSVELLYDGDEEVPKLILIQILSDDKDFIPVFSVVPNINVIDYTDISNNR